MNKNCGRGRRIFWGVWAILFALSACAASNVRYTVIDEGSHSGKRFPSLHFEIITEAAAFEKRFAEIHSGRLPPPSPPRIDFEASLVVFIALGEKPSAGYGVRVEEVTRDGKTLRVKIRREAPPADQFQATVMTQPYVLIKIKKAPGVDKIALVDESGRVIEERSIP